jgi:AcrR family transcriptional regulator
MRALGRAKLKGPVLPASGKPQARVRMLEAALKLFARQGFNGTSTRELAAALEVQPSAMYAHFASKEDVLAELTELGYSAHQKALQAALLDARPVPAEQLAALVRANARFHAAWPLLAIVVHEEVHALPEERMKVINLLRQQTVDVIRQLLERGVAAKAFDLPDLSTTAAAIGAMALRVPYWFDASAGFTVDALADAQAQLALRMVGAEAAIQAR